MRSVAFTTIGLPAPQGSKNKWGGEDNKRVKPYRDAISADAAAAMTGDLFTGPVNLSVDFYFPRPKSHYRTGKHAGTLRDDAPVYVATKPDLDKLLRAVGDALTGVVLRDDSQIVLTDARKLYASLDTAVRTSVAVGEL